MIHVFLADTEPEFSFFLRVLQDKIFVRLLFVDRFCFSIFLYRQFLYTLYAKMLYRICSGYKSKRLPIF